MNFEFKKLSPKKLVGKSVKMSLQNNRTAELWQSFMKERSHIQHIVSPALYSMQVYNGLFEFENFTPSTQFTKYALIEVDNFDKVPEDMHAFELLGGDYVVFEQRGDFQAFLELYQQIFTEWLPNSSYLIDDRPHFELLTDTYKNNHPDSEEQIWIPVQKKI